MSAPVPLEIANVVTREINEYLVTVERFLPLEDAKSLEWHDKITALKSDDHQWAKALCSAALAQLNGDVFAFESAIVDARKAGAPRDDILNAQLVAYANLTFAGKAHGVFRHAVDIKYLNLQQFLHIGVSIASFQRISELVTQAANAKLHLEGMPALPKWEKAAEILKHRDFSDEECAKVIDIAGTVLREEKLFWKDMYPKVLPDESQGTVLLRYRVARTAEAASEMTGRFVDRLFDAGMEHAPLMVTFVGSVH